MDFERDADLSDKDKLLQEDEHSDQEEDDVGGSDTSDENGNNNDYQPTPTQNADSPNSPFKSFLGSFSITDMRDFHRQLQGPESPVDLLTQLNMKLRGTNGGVSEPNATLPFNSAYFSQHPSTSKQSYQERINLANLIYEHAHMTPQNRMMAETLRLRLDAHSNDLGLSHPQNVSYPNTGNNIVSPQNFAQTQNQGLQNAVPHFQAQSIAPPSSSSNLQGLQNAVSHISPNPSDGPSSNGSAQSQDTSTSRSTPQQSREWCQEEQYKQVRQLYEITNEPERKEFLDKLFQFMCDISRPINRLPIMAKAVLDLYELFKLVVARGGLVEVINKKLWQEIIKGLNLPSSITSAAFTLRTQYMKYLYPYECKLHNFSTNEQLKAAIDGNKREGRQKSYNQVTPAQLHHGLQQLQMPQNNMAHSHLGGIPQAHHAMMPGASHAPMPPMQQFLPQNQQLPQIPQPPQFPMDLHLLLSYVRSFSDDTQNQALESLHRNRFLAHLAAASAGRNQIIPPAVNDEPQSEALNLSENCARRKRRHSSQRSGQPSRRRREATYGDSLYPLNSPADNSSSSHDDSPRECNSPIPNGSAIQNGSPMNNGSPIRNGSPITNGSPMHNGFPARNGFAAHNRLAHNNVPNTISNEASQNTRNYSDLTFNILNPEADQQRMEIRIRVNGKLFKGEISSVGQEPSKSPANQK